MSNLEKRLTKLEDIVTTHLRESGIIQTDLLWLKRAFWTLAGTGMTALFAYLFKR